jgi:hypothetical protein
MAAKIDRKKAWLDRIMRDTNMLLCECCAATPHCAKDLDEGVAGAENIRQGVRLF